MPLNRNAFPCVNAIVLYLSYNALKSSVGRAVTREAYSTPSHRLRQLRRVRKSRDDGSAATLVHAFVTSHVDYCNALYAGAPKTVTDKLQRVLNAAARVVSDTRKFDLGLTTLLHAELHWLDGPESHL